MTYGFEEFAAQLLGVAQAALPYIGAGVVAGLVVFALLLGIRSALRTWANFMLDRAYASMEPWQREGFDSQDEYEQQQMYDYEDDRH